MTIHPIFPVSLPGALEITHSTPVHERMSTGRIATVARPGLLSRNDPASRGSRLAIGFQPCVVFFPVKTHQQTRCSHAWTKKAGLWVVSNAVVPAAWIFFVRCGILPALMERQLIAWLREHLPPHPLLRLGPGDDAAVLRMAHVDECVVTVDMLTDHVDFQLAEVDPRRVGRKALAANLSDLAAMAAKPLAGVIALALPRQGGTGTGHRLVRRHVALGRTIRSGHRRRRHQQLGRAAGHQHYACWAK